MIRAVIAILAGFLTVALLSVGTDFALRMAGVFPPSPQILTQEQFAGAALYRALFTVLGGAVTAALAPERGYRLVWILGGIGTLAGLAGVAAWFAAATDLGPLWYAASIPISALPCTLLGAWAALRRM